MDDGVAQKVGPILEIENLSISFFARAFEIPAVMDFSCTVMPGEAMGIVGESGCGKSTASSSRAATWARCPRRSCAPCAAPRLR